MLRGFFAFGMGGLGAGKCGGQQAQTEYGGCFHGFSKTGLKIVLIELITNL